MVDGFVGRLLACETIDEVHTHNGAVLGAVKTFKVKAVSVNGREFGQVGVKPCDGFWRQ